LVIGVGMVCVHADLGLVCGWHWLLGNSRLCIARVRREWWEGVITGEQLIMCDRPLLGGRILYGQGDAPLLPGR
jgi:hypothetical protein